MGVVRAVHPDGRQAVMTEAHLASLAHLGWGRLDGRDIDPSPPDDLSDRPAGAPEENALRAEWAAYAESLGIAVPAEANRNAIRNSVELFDLLASIAGDQPEKES